MFAFYSPMALHCHHEPSDPSGLLFVLFAYGTSNSLPRATRISYCGAAGNDHVCGFP